MTQHPIPDSVFDQHVGIVGNTLATLRSRDLIAGDRHAIVASKDLFND